jgi:hypothetical protein
MLKSTTASTRAEDGEEDEEVEGKRRAWEVAMAATESERIGGGWLLLLRGAAARRREKGGSRLRWV